MPKSTWAEGTKLGMNEPLAQGMPDCFDEILGVTAVAGAAPVRVVTARTAATPRLMDETTPNESQRLFFHDILGGTKIRKGYQT